MSVKRKRFKKKKKKTESVSVSSSAGLELAVNVSDCSAQRWKVLLWVVYFFFFYFLFFFFFFLVIFFLFFFFFSVPTGSPSRGGDVAGYVFDINQPSLSTPLYSVLASISVFMALSTLFCSINSPDNSLLSRSVLPVLCLPYWSFQLYISLWKSPSALI